MLSKTAKKLDNIGMNFIAVPCNTVQIFYDEMKESVSIPVMNIIDETAKKIKSSGFKKSGLLAAEITYNLYKKYFKKYGIELIVPDKEDKIKITGIIMNILNGKNNIYDKNVIKEISEKLVKNGAECIILGCTDLPVIIKDENMGVKLFDTIKILAESTVEFSLSDSKNLFYDQNKIISD